MSEYNGFVQNFNLINCYVDTSYYDRKLATIVTSKFSNEEEQTQRMSYYFVIVPNAGFKLKPEFSFKLQPQIGTLYDENIEWLEITNQSFQPLTKVLNLKLDLAKDDFQLAGVDLNNSLVYETEVNGTPVYLFLFGGFNEYKLIFGLYQKFVGVTSSYYGDDKVRGISFSFRISDGGGGTLGYASLLNDLMFTGEGGEIETDINNSFFTTYYIDINTLREIEQSGSVHDELIINTYSYPIKFNDEQLVESTIKTGYISTEVIAKIFKNNYTSLDIFRFTIPDISNVTDCYVRIPFNSDISLNYEI